MQLLNQEQVEDKKEQIVSTIPEKKAIKNEIDAVEDLLLDDFSFEDNNSDRKSTRLNSSHRT